MEERTKKEGIVIKWPILVVGVVAFVIFLCTDITCALKKPSFIGEQGAVDSTQQVVITDTVTAPTTHTQGITGGKSVRVAREMVAPATDAAPITPDMLVPVEVADYIKRFAPVAVAEMDKFGIPASISLAQGLVESRAGTSTLAKKNKNHFGIKCFSKKCRKGHCRNHTDDTHKDFFRVYKTDWESWRAHSRLLSTKRYTPLRKFGTDYKKWARGLKDIGYATDPSYDLKLIGTIERYDLQKFDNKFKN